MKKIGAILLILVFSTTVLPIGQVGSLLASNQLNEEVCQQGNPIMEEKAKHCHFDASFNPHDLLVDLSYSAFLESPRMQHKEDIPHSPSSDILIPPPKGS